MKALLYLLLTIVIVVVTTVFLITNNTNWLLATANYIQDTVSIEADELTVDLFSSTLTGQNIKVSGAFGDVTVDTLSAEFGFNDWSNDDPFWSLTATGIKPTLTPQDSTKSDPSEPPVLPLNFRFIELKELTFQEQVWSLRVDNLGANTLNVNLQEASDLLAAKGTVQIAEEFDQVTYNFSNFNVSTEAMSLSAKGAKGDVVFEPLSITGSIEDVSTQTFASTEKETTTEPEEQPLFSDVALPPLPFLGEAMTLEHTISNLQLSGIELNNVKISMSSSPSSLVLQQISAHTTNGSFVASGDVQQVDDKLATSMTIESDGITLADLGITENDIISGGSTALRVNLTSTGATAAEMAASLNGNSRLALTNAVMQEGAINGIGSDLVLEMMNKLNPFRNEEPTTSVECALVDLVAKDGVITADNGLVFETDKMKIVGNGRVDLPTESLDVTISPTAREGIGINLGSLVKFVKLGGTLQKPTPEIGALGILQSGAAITAAVSTGGLSVVAEGLAKRAINTGSACEQIAAD